MTQHDQKPEHETSASNPNGETVTTTADNVTREQGGQFYEESGDFSGRMEPGIEAEQEISMNDAGAETVNALQVNMDRSGAEHIHAQKAFLTNSGAKSIDGQSSKLTGSGVLQLRADSATFHQSSAVLVNAGTAQFDGGSVVMNASEKAIINEGANVTVLQAASVEASGDIKAFAVIGADVRAGGNVQATMDSATAAVFGAVFGAVFALLWRIIRRG